MSNTTMTDSNDPKPQPEPVKSELSPATQAVLDVYETTWGQGYGSPLAAALRAAADQCKIEWNYHPDYPETESVIIVSDLLAIAAELEAQAN
jgi:hypothetical protein